MCVHVCMCVCVFMCVRHHGGQICVFLKDIYAFFEFLGALPVRLGLLVRWLVGSLVVWFVG